MTINKLSEALLLAVKSQKLHQDLVAQIANLEMADLQNELQDDNHKKAFWINIYNAFFQILSRQKIDKPAIYREKLINVAGENFSLDDVEHGILRRYRIKLSLGYLPNVLASSLVKNLAVSAIDYRIHFALNCGAVSCPPIAFYSAEKLDSQLEMATLSFLENETKINQENKEIYITQLFKWYHADFGGNTGIRQILAEKLGLETEGFAFKYSPYSWTEQLDNYA